MIHRSWLAFELLALICWNISDRGILAKLQRANISGNRPAVFGPDLLPVVGHHAKAVGHDVEEMADRRLAQTLDVHGRRRAIAAPHDHSLSGADAIMTGGTKNIVALPSSRKHGKGHGKGKRIDEFPPLFSLV